MSSCAAAPVGPGSIQFPPEKQPQIDICGLFFATCACCICPQIWRVFYLSDNLGDRVVLVNAVGLGSPKTSWQKLGEDGSIS